MGRIGYQVARRATGFDMSVVDHNRNRRPEHESESGAQYVGFRDLLAQSDFLVVSLPLNNDTKGLIGVQFSALCS